MRGSLRPAAGTVRHYRYVITHITVVFRKGYSRINGGFTGGNRHIRGVGDKDGSVGKGSARLRVDKLAELLQNLRHLVSSLAAADVYDNIRIAPLCKLVLGHGLSCAEAAGYSCRTAFSHGNNGVDYAPVIKGLVMGRRRFEGLGSLIGHFWQRVKVISASSPSTESLRTVSFTVYCPFSAA